MNKRATPKSAMQPIARCSEERTLLSASINVIISIEVKNDAELIIHKIISEVILLDFKNLINSKEYFYSLPNTLNTNLYEKYHKREKCTKDGTRTHTTITDH